MFPSTIALRQSSTALRRPVLRSTSIASTGLGIAGRRWNTQEQRGGKSKLIFRFGLRDIPVELYPMAFVVAAACVGAGFAVGRHFYLDGLRIGPTGKKE
ncbi:hypothetical protein L486_08159 [Kwoniella mangroviensis CBS 10435]|uniref:Uncharacterized protein n=1 Tax=Kwoniella mangroviensis CBS 10435 TaxID=1331196 RepID=A0A1B9IFB8_9TREE|nr:uncharacterized protein I203_07800 [Kwoniella mangroviensis CBS 8507]OCF54245.1 hypothetical protein L486_08159 [Kwoniella mangroviensis CBS 10435]OCF63064.1 hypothetical protein I203_07800 [Kwoniella mangroviensis CBS 8507]OCF73976.1 hypothetical protein I204_05826 [Kwoniella mangroviensis CBS 8886]